MGVMAIGTTGAAQAETGACFGYISGASLPCFSTTLEALPVVAVENKSATLLVGGLNIEVLCGTAAFIEGGTLSANGSILLGRVEFGECISLSKTPTLTQLTKCTPKDPVAGLGKIRTEKGTGLIVLHNGEPVVKLSPDVAPILAKIFLGESCAVSEELIVTGNLVLQDQLGKAAFEKHAVTHLIREFPGLQLLRVGGVLSTIDGTANITLGGTHTGFEWAGKPA